MNLNQLYYFRKLAELQNYTKAAAELYISQPSLSYSITKLEEVLGASLFKKKGRNVVLTRYGEKFYLCVNEVLTKLDDGVAMLKQTVDASASKIVIGTIQILSVDFVSKNIRAFTDSHPKTPFDIITCATSDAVIAGIKDGIYDMGFCYKTENEKDLIFMPILRQEFAVITNVGHKLSGKTSLNLADISECPLITYRENNPLHLYISNLFKEQNIEPYIVLSFDDDITISEMVAQNFGIAIVVDTPILRNHNVSIVPLNANSASAILYLAYRKDAILSSSSRGFINQLKKNTNITYSKM